MQKKHQAIALLFKALTGKSVINVPKLGEPSAGYQTARGTERYYR